MPFLILRIGFWLFLQVAQVLLTLPYSFSQLGMLSGIIFQVFYGILGSWTAYLISVLYVEYRSRKEKENVNFKNHVIQVSILPILARRKFQFLTMPKGLKPILIHSLFFFLKLFAVVWSARWFIGSILESSWVSLQLYFSPLWICHSAYRLCKVCNLNTILMFIFGYQSRKMGFSFSGGLLKD